MYRLGINGYGRIGRSVLRALSESPQLSAQMQVVAINEPADCETICHLTRFDSTHGRFPGHVDVANDCLTVNGQTIQLSHQKDVAAIHWPDVDMVLECSGAFTDRLTAELHLRQGAAKVLFSQPALESDVDATVVYGVNHDCLKASDVIISNASCTTNGSVPVLQLIDESYGIASASITTIHSAMNDQPVIDAYHHTDLRKTRSASQSMIPVDTGLAKGIERFLPNLSGLLSAQAIRIPTVNVSAMDISIVVNETVTVEQVNTLLQQYAAGQPAIIGFNDQPLTSIDFNHDARSCIVDGTQTRVSGGRLLKLFIWFDNEWAYANRMLDVAAHCQIIQRHAEDQAGQQSHNNQLEDAS